MEQYEPFSEEWEKYLYKQVNKRELIALYKNVCREVIALKTAYKLHLQGVNNTPLEAIHDLARNLSFPEFEAYVKRNVAGVPLAEKQKCPVCSSTDVFSFVSLHSKCRTCKEQWTD